MGTSEQKSGTAGSGATDTRIQEPYLNQLRKTRRNVVIYLLSGVRLTGRIASFDQHFIALQGADLQVINKDAIASIMPGPPTAAKRPGPRPPMGQGAPMHRANTAPPAQPRVVTVTTRRSRIVSS
ncbi:MAG TPA: RNA chaperone Hfq [Burkholderiales bacterium]|jgi:host factor-I protein